MFGDKFLSNTWPCDKITIIYCLNECWFCQSNVQQFVSNWTDLLFWFRRRTGTLFGVVGAVLDDSGYYDVIVTPQRPSNLFRFLLLQERCLNWKCWHPFLWTLWRNQNRTVVLLRGGWRSLDFHVHGIVWLIMVTLGQLNGPKLLV